MRILNSLLARRPVDPLACLRCGKPRGEYAYCSDLCEDEAAWGFAIR